MEPEDVVDLFESSWFYLNVLKTRPISFTPPQPSPNPQIEGIRSNTEISRHRPIHSRSKSDQLLKLPNADEDLFLPQNSRTPILQSIPSGREMAPLEIPKTSKFEDVDHKKKRRFTKSLSELEFEEMKGFMDLGFVFAEEDKEDPSLLEIVPGLQKLGLREQGAAGQTSGPRAKPYLSEAWEVYDRQAGPGPLWIPSARNESDMKVSLKLWAHGVASAVR